MINKIKSMIKKKWNREIEEKDIRLEELKQLQKEGALIVDVRSPQEYREGHIDGAISIPEYDIKKDENIEEIITKLTDEMLKCASKMEFEKAAELRDKIKELQDLA